MELGEDHTPAARDAAPTDSPARIRDQNSSGADNRLMINTSDEGVAPIN